MAKEITIIDLTVSYIQFSPIRILNCPMLAKLHNIYLSSTDHQLFFLRKVFDSGVTESISPPLPAKLGLGLILGFQIIHNCLQSRFESPTVHSPPRCESCRVVRYATDRRHDKSRFGRF
ncbi:hypothetical protein TNCV_1779131 [Trichonephila clavipes]|nr:hypothetical protein TNCV_1779131 [Trichonephila clavipes]